MAHITAWRLVKPRYARSAYDGEGSRRFGGRWNPTGHAVAYASESRALAALELLVHLKDLRLLESQMLVPCTFDPMHAEAVTAAQLPDGWNTGHGNPMTQNFGAQWLTEQRTAILAVPSVIIQAEQNFLFNPTHPDFEQCVVGAPEAFAFDARLNA